MTLLIPSRRLLLAPNPLAKSLLRGLTGVWPLSGGSGGDLSGFGNHLTASVSVPTSAVGLSGRLPLASQFTAANSQNFSRASSTPLQIGDLFMDIVAWVYQDTLPGVDARMEIIAKWVGATKEYKLGVFNNSGVWTRFDFQVRDAADATQPEVSASTFGNVTTGTWYFVHAYHNPSTDLIGISVNNGVHDTAALVGGGRSTATAFTVGSSSDAGTYQDGREAMVSMWKLVDRNLTAAELTYLYNGGQGRRFGGSQGFV